MFSRFKGGIDTARAIAAQQIRQNRRKLAERLEQEPSLVVQGWCSWCGEFSQHTLRETRKIARPTYRCEQCSLPTIPCRFCDNMARAAGLNKKAVVNADTGVLNGFFTNKWNHELCAEHDGSISDFSRAHEKIDELSDFRPLMQPRQPNLFGLAKKTGMVAGGAAVVGAGAWLAAPGIASAIGASGALGAAKTGTAIATLKGSALTSASLAKLGTGGLALIAAAGAGLGGKTGFGLANAYLKDIPDYDFICLREAAEGNSHRVIVVNGFLTEKDKKAEDWLSALEGRFEGSGIWYLNWEAKTLLKLGMLAQSLVSKSTSARLARTVVQVASKKMARRVSMAGGVLAAARLADNPWHSAMLNAEKAGSLLAEAISRTDGKSYTLIGHSLGARVVFFALLALAKKQDVAVDYAILLGAAVGRNKTEDWQTAAQLTRYGLYNCYSSNDGILRFLYQGANLGMSRPAGLAEAAGSCDNLDCSKWVAGHTCWIEQLAGVLQEIECG